MGFQVVVANTWGCETAPVCCDRWEKSIAFPPLLGVLAIDTSDPAIAMGSEVCLTLSKLAAVASVLCPPPNGATQPRMGKETTVHKMEIKLQ